MTTSLVRQNYHEECEQAINKQITLELHASYLYMAMANHFERDDVALPGFSKYFKKHSEEERGHAQQFMTYQNKRGGRIQLRDIPKPTKSEWSSGLEALQVALELEKQVNEALLTMHTLADKHDDPHLQDFIEEDYLEDQVQMLKELGDYITNLKRVGPGLGEYLFDKHTLSSS